MFIGSLLDDYPPMNHPGLSPGVVPASMTGGLHPSGGMTLHSNRKGEWSMSRSRSVLTAWLIAMCLVFAGAFELVRAEGPVSATPESGSPMDPAVLAEAERLIQDGQAQMEQGRLTNDRLLIRSGMRSIRDGMKIKRALGIVETVNPAPGLEQR
jgi:hypothetical protein